MAANKKSVSTATTKTSKKERLTAYISKLEPVLSDLKNELGEKKFSRRLKKACKVLLHGIDAERKPALPMPKAPKASKAVSTPKPVKKATTKKAAAVKPAKKRVPAKPAK